jgi:predicted nucleic acid-binding protein
MIFVDSGAWYALLVMNDSNHQAAEQWFNANNERLITSDYILDESLTLLRRRGLHHQASMLGQGLLANRLAELVYLKIDVVEAAWDVFQQYNDKHGALPTAPAKC